MAAPNKSSVKIAPGAVVCDECELIGDITIGARTVIHPKARIIAEAGPVIIGEFNIIEELVHITNRFPDGAEGKKNSQVMVIGNNNVFEVGAQIESTKVGDHNVIESKAFVGPQVELTSGCIIGAACHVTTGEKLPENTVIYGAKCHRRIQRERPPAQNLQIDFLTKILPNYHYLKKVSKAQSPPK
ncbi:dynactin subunit 6-like isoform X1 [Littorina saxatilis]|uniref:Dynactin subunit 6 n=1 Tax=Littorina saxatilis TaxID=31220 RepID=A0AAN9AYT5_9CAEN